MTKSQVLRLSTSESSLIPLVLSAESCPTLAALSVEPEREVSQPVLHCGHAAKRRITNDQFRTPKH